MRCLLILLLIATTANTASAQLFGRRRAVIQRPLPVQVAEQPAPAVQFVEAAPIAPPQAPPTWVQVQQAPPAWTATPAVQYRYPVMQTLAAPFRAAANC